MTVRAIYENGVFKPSTAVTLPEHAVVELQFAPLVEPQPSRHEEAMRRIHEALRMRFDSTDLPTDLAERHNEHQP